MDNINKLIKRAKLFGFDEVVYLNVSTIKLMDEVRSMCRENKCHKYNTNWSCPPGCGSLEEGREKLKKYSKGIIVQTIGEIEDSLDFETMIKIEEKGSEMCIRDRNNIMKLWLLEVVVVQFVINVHTLINHVDFLKNAYLLWNLMVC